MAVCADARTDKAQNLSDVWQEKEYRNLPSVVMSYVNKDNTVSAEARLCWYELFNLAYFNKSWCIQISKSELGEMFSKGSSSIERYLNDLKKAGYVDIVNVRVRGVWLPSKITVTVPDPLFDILSQTPKRKKISKLELVVDNTNSLPQDVPPDLTVGYPHIWGEGIPTSGGSKSNINHNNKYTNNNTDLGNNIHSGSVDDSVVVFPDDELLASNPEPLARSELSTKLSDLDSQISSLSKLLGFEKTSKSGEQVPALEQELAALEADRLRMLSEIKTKKIAQSSTKSVGYSVGDGALSGNGERSNTKTISDTPPSNPNNSDVVSRGGGEHFYADSSSAFTPPLSSSGDLAEQEPLVDAGKEAEKKDLRRSSAKKPKDINSCVYFDRKGDREVSEEIKKDVLEKMAEIGITNEVEKYKLANEMAYEVRFGSLKKAKVTGDPITVRHGFNIALKLLREKGWEKPTGISLDQGTRPQPAFWPTTDVSNVDFSGGVKSINRKNVVARGLN